ncbi:hydantoinase/oxoprolinase family protein [Phytohabitans sp. ZYX-F-186]|uniref:Hydantoinase/oxoprolinase family protein n=1 Tax=Phytohabitans maris TaxID=3071409 RepID=A0ABU0ZNP4_9ACTN|nr:hydantoinase/oxoprolinase family protein [Phytohabitans sp. ZYX-F-186]MDQ7908027.1 hydantoinase/oxoprolinase family protein [Phytohabitans sp. ZYX-F-186]
MASGLTLGVDVGGTFTDFIVVDEAGAVHCFKVPSTPSRPARSTITGFGEIVRELGLSAERLAAMQHTHSSTIATNAVIERRGPAIGVLVTDGFRDLFELQRLAVPDPLRYDSQRPTPLVARSLVAEVTERMGFDGGTVTPLDEEQLVEQARRLRARGCESFVVCFLHAYVNGAHEAAAREVLRREFPDVPVEVSSEVWPQAREYERATLTVINASIRPIMQAYLDEIAEGMRGHGLANEATIARSNGGMQRAHTIRAWPVAALLSGPAAGVAGAARAAAESGWDRADLITIDVGGTSADIGVVRAGSPLLSAEETIAQMPVLVPTIAVSAIGAGGGSIIWVDELGTLKVGPQSLGADPAPACYGKQTHTPGLSDAFLLAGWLSDEQRLGGRIGLSLDGARTALSRVADRMGASVEDVADGAVRIAIAMMAAEASKVLARRGVDAPAFRLVAFGGAGPLIGALLAEEIYVDSVLIPPTPGALSAFGAARSDLEGDLVAPVYRKLSVVEPGDVAAAWKSTKDRAAEWLANEQDSLPVTGTVVSWSLEMRYEGQGFDVNVPVEERWLVDGDAAALGEAFHRAHEATFGHASRGSDIWVKEMRAHLVSVVAKPESVHMAGTGRTGDPVLGRREIRLAGGTVTATVYDRALLAAGQELTGPAIVEQMDTTVLVPTGWRAEVDPSGSLQLHRVK